MTDAEKVNILRQNGFTGVDVSIISKVKRPDYYGVQLSSEALDVLGIRAAESSGSQIERILDYANKMGSITSYEASNYLNIMSFTKRMSEIRRDPRIEIKQAWETNGRTRWLRYTIKQKDEKDIESAQAD